MRGHVQQLVLPLQPGVNWGQMRLQEAFGCKAGRPEFLCHLLETPFLRGAAPQALCIQVS